MKKFLSILLCILLTAAPAICKAEEAQSKQPEILFRGIPWLVSINEAVEKLDPYNLGVKGRLWSNEYMRSWGLNYIRVSSENSGFEYSVSDAANILFVAGHPVREMYLFALYGYTENYVSADANDSQFYKGEYYFDDEDKLMAYEDLYGKLSKLYGTPSDEGVDGVGKYAIWYGANDTGVILRYSDWDILYLSYGRTDADDLILGLKAAFLNQNKGEGDGGYDGL